MADADIQGIAPKPIREGNGILGERFGNGRWVE